MSNPSVIMHVPPPNFTEYEDNKNDNFIMGFHLNDTKICDNLIDYHTEQQNVGETYDGAFGEKLVVNKDIKTIK